MTSRPGIFRVASFLIFLFSTLFGVAQGSYTIYEQDNKFGLKDADDKVVIPAKYKRLGWSKGLTLPVGDVIGYYEDSWGLLSLRDRRISHPRYYTLEAIHRDLILASQRGRFSNELLYGALNSKGETVIEFRYHSIKCIKDLLIVSERIDGVSKYGMLSESNIQLLPLEYLAIEPFINGLFKFETFNNRLGVVGADGRMLIPARLDSIGQWNGKGFLIYESGRIGIMDSLANILIEPQFKTLNSELKGSSFSSIELHTTKNLLLKVDADSIHTTTNGFVLVYRNDFVEILGSDGNVITRYPSIDIAKPYRENLVVNTSYGVEVFDQSGSHWPGNTFEDVKLDEHFLYAKTSGGWHVYNAFGRKISKRPYEDVLSGSNHLIPVKKRGYWGYLDPSGETAVSFRFEVAGPFVGLIAAVEYVGYKMLINQFGEQVGEPAYDSVLIQPDNMAVVQLKSRTDLLNASGAAIFQTYNELIPHSAGYLELTADGDVGLISKQGKIIFYPHYNQVSDLTDDQFLAVKSADGVGMSLKDGSWLIRPTERFQEIAGSHDGHTAIKINDQWGFVNRYQQLVIANRYDSVRFFYGGLAAIQVNGKWGFLSKRDKIVVQPNFDHVEDFDAERAIVTKSKKMGVLKPDGTYLLPLEYDKVIRVGEKLFLAQKEGRFGVFGLEGNQVLPVSFENIAQSSDAMIVKRRGKMGVVGLDGQYVIPLKYDLIEETSAGMYSCTLLP